MKTEEQYLDDFWKRVDKDSTPDGCWLWTGAIAGYGYGGFSGGPTFGQYAHRASWMMANGGPIPDGMFVCHRCDEPLCVRPTHLFLGTPQDNAADCVKKGRARRGVRSPEERMTKGKIIAIRQDAADGLSRAEIAVKHGVTWRRVSSIVKRRVWKKVAQAPSLYEWDHKTTTRSSKVR